MTTSVFLSYPRPYLGAQARFIKKLKKYLDSRGLKPRTLGVTDYDMQEPLSAVRSLLLESSGLIAIAFRRSYIKKGRGKPDSDMKDVSSYSLSKKWLTTPWCQIESAMAFQIGLPVLIFREKGVIEEGILEKGVFGTYMPEFDFDDPSKYEKGPIDGYFDSSEFKEIIYKWEAKVGQVVAKRGRPPHLYDE